MTKLASTLPKALEDDGLASLNRRLIENPEQQHLVVAVVDCKKTETVIDEGATIATARVVQIEPVYDEADQDTVAEVLRRASDKRNGRVALPLDLPRG
jgi:hypothetical protein